MPSLHAALIDQLAATQDGEPWYGSSRAAALDGVTAAQAASHPIEGAPSIWELVLHMTSWTREVARRLGGAAPGAPKDGDWPDVGKATEARWQAAQLALASANDELVEAIRGLDEAALARRVGDSASRELGTGPSAAAMLLGLAQHDAYHIGQLFTTRRALDAVVEG